MNRLRNGPRAATLRQMASLRKDVYIDAPPTLVWGALRDIGALHTKLVPGFVTDTRMDGQARIVTFGNGAVAREEIVSVDEKRRRVCWAILDPPFQHYSAAAWVEPDGDGCRFSWSVDLLPDEMASRVEGMMTAGIEVIRKTMESTAAN